MGNRKKIYDDDMIIKLSHETKVRAANRAEELDKTLSSYVRDLIIEDLIRSGN